VHWRVDIGEVPFVRGDHAYIRKLVLKHTRTRQDQKRTVRVHVPLAQEENQLVLREVRIDFSEWDHVKSQVP
jgi:hypothetical protein